MDWLVYLACYKLIYDDMESTLISGHVDIVICFTAWLKGHRERSGLGLR